MPGIFLRLSCGACGYQGNFTLGGTYQVYDDLDAYMKANRLRKVPVKLSDGAIRQSVGYSLCQCTECGSLYGVTHRVAQDVDDNIDERIERAKCPRCKGKGRHVDEFEEDLTALSCPECMDRKLVDEVMGHWDP